MYIYGITCALHVCRIQRLISYLLCCKTICEFSRAIKTLTTDLYIIVDDFGHLSYTDATYLGHSSYTDVLYNCNVSKWDLDIPY